MKSHSFQDLLDDIRSRLDRIELDHDLFTIRQRYDAEKEQGTVDVYYREQLIVSFYYFRSNYTDGDRFKRIGVCTVKRYKYPEWYDEYKNHKSRLTVHVDEYYRAHVNGNDYRELNHYLDEYLPISHDGPLSEVDACLRRHNLNDCKIVFDTFSGRYVIEMDLESYFQVPIRGNKGNLCLYKYTSQETYCNMLNHGMFRMNSIVAMNDASETLWADFVTGDGHIDDNDYYTSVVRNRNKLVTSLTPLCDNATMWRLYGNNGNGVCLAFDVPASEMTKVIYVNENDTGFQRLRQVRQELEKKNIQVDFRDLDNMRLYIKSSSFSVEVEYRYVYDAKDELLGLANYGTILSPYKDFKYNKDIRKFEELPFRFSEVTFGNNIPNKRTVFPLLVAETDIRFPGVTINRESKVWELR